MRLIDADALKEYIDMQKGRPFIGCTIGEALKMMTDAQPTVNQWIPCSREMPPVGKTVLVTVKTENDIWTDCDTWYQGDWMAYMGNDREVIAWGELPEPYQEADK